MIINSARLLELKEKFGEAFYLLDSKQFRDNFLELKQSFSSIYPKFNIAYSYKTNYTPKLCKIVDELGGYAEVVSEMELELAYRIGVEPQNIIWNGPIKDPEKMEELLLKGGTVNLDSLEEWDAVKKISEKWPMNTLNVGIRCNFDVQDGVLSRFGFDVTSHDFYSLINDVKKTNNICLINLQCHYAKRQVEFWPARAQGMIDLIDKLDIIPQRIDLGGGLFGKMPASLKAQFDYDIPDYSAYAHAAATVFSERFAGMADKMPELIIEPGSALVGDCMKFVATVKTIKQVRGKYMAAVLGSQKNISMQGINPPIEIYHLSSTRQSYRDLDFVGFTCIENDVLYKHYKGELAVGDMIVISNCGSYSLVMKPPFILPNFPILDISEGETEVIKRGETFDDLFHTFYY